MSFVRTVLGDVSSEQLGVCYAHEHLVIDGGGPVRISHDFLLDDVDRAVAEIDAAKALGLGAVVDAMPCDAGRNARKLAAVSTRTGVHVVGPTGLHLELYYDDLHWGRTASVDELAGLFVADVLEGIDEGDYGGPLVRRTPHRAGVVKIAGSADRLTPRERRVFEAAAQTHRRTGCPILTHCTDGTAALEQVALLTANGVPAGHIALSHVDKVVDRGYHREILSTGAFVEYDQGFRWPPDAPNGTLQLLEWALEDGSGGQVLLGLDAARRGYWTAYGGRPGWTFLLGPFASEMSARGISEEAQRRFFVDNPAAVYAFAAPT